MSFVLSIETATSVCSVALHQNGKLLGCQSLLVEKSHSSHLIVMIEQVLKNCRVEMNQLQAVGVSKGPGSYTGLRIGVSTAKGLCYTLGIPLIGVNTLIGMAHQIGKVPRGVDFLCPMIDARRMEVYCAMLNSQLEEVMETSPVVVTAESFSEWMNRGKVLFFGNGSNKCSEVLNGTNMNSMFVQNFLPSASSIGMLAGTKLKQGEIEDLSGFQPLYLKPYKTTIPKKRMGIIDEK